MRWIMIFLFVFLVGCSNEEALSSETESEGENTENGSFPGGNTSGDTDANLGASGNDDKNGSQNGDQTEGGGEGEPDDDSGSPGSDNGGSDSGMTECVICETECVVCEEVGGALKDGTRLVHRNFYSPDGAVLQDPLTSVFDQELGVECAPAQGADGKYRYYPSYGDMTALHATVFSDDDCSVPLLHESWLDGLLCSGHKEMISVQILRGASGCATAPTYQTPSYYQVDRELTEADFHVVETMYHWKAGEGCVEYPQLSVLFYDLSVLEQYHVPDSDFVLLERD